MKQGSKRPLGVTILSMFILVLAPIYISLLIYSYVKSSSLGTPLPGRDYLFSFLAYGLNCIAAIQLMSLKARAFWIFLTGIVVGSLPFIISLFTGDTALYLNKNTVMQTFLGMGFWAMVMSYLWSLKKKGVLSG